MSTRCIHWIILFFVTSGCSADINIFQRLLPYVRYTFTRNDYQPGVDRINVYTDKLGRSSGKAEHAVLLLDRGFLDWAKEADIQNGNMVTEQHNNAAHALHVEAASIGVSTLYKKAYENWRQQLIESGENARVWFGTLENRMFLGMGEASPLQAGITLHHTYGVPFIPGSAIKGVLN